MPITNAQADAIQKRIAEIRDFEFNGKRIPDHMHDGLAEYIEIGLSPGGFLYSVLTNDLSAAVGKADLRNQNALIAYVGYLYNRAPSSCWGSVAAVDAWIETHRTTKKQS